MARIDALDKALIEELGDLLDAEKQLTRALPRLAKAASTDELRTLFEEHLEQTREHIDRLNAAFERLGAPARGRKCDGIRGIIAEGEDVVSKLGKGLTLDAAVIGAAQKAEHYEIATYGTVRTWAKRLGHSDVASLLEQTLNEEKEADRRLTQLAEGSINPQAAEAADEAEAEGREAAPARRSRPAPRVQAA
ncbi:MAG TPA: ferritin-like domain-containing protein, partial [Vicinamibacterales bacterium]|nr:ferritin-like domain-containing protein [Vicinamibacterales bacterium]